MGFKEMLNSTGTVVKKNGPAIMTGMAIVSGVTGTASAVVATTKAAMILEEEASKRGYRLDTYVYNEDPMLIVKRVWKEYIPTAIFMSMSIGLTIGGMYLQNRRYAALAGVYAISETQFTNYREKVKDAIGDKKEKVISEKVVEDTAKPIKESSIFKTGKGDTLCYDVTSGRYFYSDREYIHSAINDANSKMLNGWNFLTLNDLYSFIGLPSIGIGKDLGWNVDRIIKPDFSSILAPNGAPCLALDFENKPHSDYY